MSDWMKMPKEIWAHDKDPQFRLWSTHQGEPGKRTRYIRADQYPEIEGIDRAYDLFRNFVLTGESGGAAMMWPIEQMFFRYARRAG